MQARKILRPFDECAKVQLKFNGVTRLISKENGELEHIGCCKKLFLYYFAVVFLPILLQCLAIALTAHSSTIPVYFRILIFLIWCEVKFIIKRNPKPGTGR